MNDINDGTFITLNVDGKLCDLEPFESNGNNQNDLVNQDSIGRFGMVLNNATVLRICGPSVGLDQADLVCFDYNDSANRFESSISLEGQARSKSAVIEIAPGRYWITGRETFLH